MGATTARRMERRAEWSVAIRGESGSYNFAEQATPMSLRMLIEARDPQKVLLKSEAAYDVTALVLWLIILAALFAGWWQLAAVVGGMKVLAGGRSAAKQV